MAKKKTPKDYDYYTMKLPIKLKELFERYIKKFESLGFINVSQFCLHILQEEAKNIIEKNPELERDYKELN